EHESVMAEREYAGDAVDQVQADGRDAPDPEEGEHLDQLRAARVVHQEQHQDQHADGGGVEDPTGELRSWHQTFSDRSSPTMPLGRSRRMRIIARKAKVSLYSVMPGKLPVRGKRAVRKFSRKPSRTPPITAPGRLPMPPITAAANALMPGSMPNIAGWLMLPKLMPHITPAAAASIEPRRNVEAMSLSTSTPIMRAVSAS